MRRMHRERWPRSRRHAMLHRNMTRREHTAMVELIPVAEAAGFTAGASPSMPPELAETLTPILAYLVFAWAPAC